MHLPGQGALEPEEHSSQGWSLRNIPAADFTAPAQSQDHSPPHGSLHLPEGESLLDSDTGQCVQLLSTVM